MSRDILSLDRAESARPTDLSDENDELLDYVNTYIYSGFFGAQQAFEPLLGDYNEE